MSRTSRRRAIRAVAPVAGLLAAGLLVWQGSYAAFSATTTSPSNAWATGNLALTNSTNAYGTAIGSAVWTAANASNLKPGSTDTKCITVKSTGSLGGPVKLYVTGVTQNAVNLADNLPFTIDLMTTGVTANNVSAGCTGFTGGTNIANAVPLSSLPSTYGTGLGSWTTTGNITGEYAAYRISWTVPNNNNLQGGTAAATFNWEVQA
jgi:hypothetical protein